jgi:hypothetical protein
MNIRRRIIPFTLAASLSLLAAHTTFADAFDYQSVAGSVGARSGSGQTAQSGGGSGATVQTVDLGDVTGTVCDCGEISPNPAGAGAGTPTGESAGFPKFPLLALAVLPGIIFPPNNPPIPPNLPPTSSVPEPLTLATLAAGLTALAGLRKRRV